VCARTPARAFLGIQVSGFLAPDIQKAILEGRQPASLTIEQLMRGDLPLEWQEQRRALGF
jgi:hypothetical protein